MRLYSLRVLIKNLVSCAKCRSEGQQTGACSSKLKFTINKCRAGQDFVVLVLISTICSSSLSSFWCYARLYMSFWIELVVTPYGSPLVLIWICLFGYVVTPYQVKVAERILMI